MARITKKQVEHRLGFVNSLYDTHYETTYMPHYGGWDMYIVREGSGAHSQGALGLSSRLSTKEFMAYMDGLITAFYFLTSR